MTVEQEEAAGPDGAPEATGREPRFQGSRADKQAFAKRLGDLTHGRGIRQAELARRSELTPHMISSYMLGKAIPGRINLTKMAKALGVAPDDLLPRPSEDDGVPNDAPLSLIVSRTDPMTATLRVNMQVPTALGGEIIKLLMAGRTK